MPEPRTQDAVTKNGPSILEVVIVPWMRERGRTLSTIRGKQKKTFPHRRGFCKECNKECRDCGATKRSLSFIWRMSVKNISGRWRISLKSNEERTSDAPRNTVLSVWLVLHTQTEPALKHGGHLCWIIPCR
ncbi:uncharacterized protein LOC124295281 [Neodiprion lecontei]|uniref:Uncharacterized protein LOC124295281 n=1 Tax=Neodiprion lecontei TaxID=441921 RepID=A0ABM3GK96_NEOLC|nr:uncharacterized protein LOC124295281 [Neodiprion lecontei]